MYPYHMFGWGGIDGFGMIFIWIIIVIAIVWLIRHFTSYSVSGCKFCGHSSESEKSPLNIVKERYAKGEITKKEYEEKEKEFSV